jgi:uncharacterized membrane protein YccC
MRLLGREAWLFGIKCTVAALLAAWIALAMGLPRPFWAMSTAFIVSQPLSGAVRSKAAYRAVGTLVGSAFTVFAVPALSGEPELLTLALATWLGLCLFVSLHDRTPRSYLFMLAGYTAALVGFPSVSAPEAIFDTALARVEEILLGIGCATLVHSVVLPRGVGPVLLERLDQVLQDASRWARHALDGRVDAVTAPERRRLAADVTELRLLATHLPYDTSPQRAAADALRALHDRMALLLPLIAAVEDRVRELKSMNALPDATARLLQACRSWVGEADGSDMQADVDRAPMLEAALAAADTALPSPASWVELVALNLTHRLRDLAAGLGECRRLRDHIRDGRPGLPARLDPLVRARAGGVLHLDTVMALRSGAAAATATIACSAMWILTAWPSGAIAAMMTAVFCCLFATQDDPTVGIHAFLQYTLLSMPLSALYLLGFLPAIDSFEMFALVTAPLFVPLAALFLDPSTAGRALPVLLGVTSAFALQDVGSADLPAFLSSSLAQVIAAGIAVVFMRLFRFTGVERSVQRLRRAAWRDLSEMADSAAAPDRVAFAVRMLDRLGLLAPRLQAMGAASAPDPGQGERQLEAETLDELRLGLAIADLQTTVAALDPPEAQRVRRVLRRIRNRYRALARGDAFVDPSPVAAALEAALSGLRLALPAPARDRAALALASVRRVLRAHAPEFHAPPAAWELQPS